MDFLTAAVIIASIASVLLSLQYRKVLLLKKETGELREENVHIKQRLAQAEIQTNYVKAKESEILQEHQNIEGEKKKIEEKNKKLWRMSEAALKESHRVEEANQLLQTEKEKVETEKKKLDEKVKKLWQTSLTIHKEKERISELNEIIEEAKKRSDELLLNILPEEAAEELKATGKYAPRLFNNVSVLFTDFKGFTTFSEGVSPDELVNELNVCFMAFDTIMEKYNIEKIKTIGDAYLAVSGLPLPTDLHANDMISAALEIRDFMLQRRAEMGNATFEIRIGIHSGSVVAGIVGIKKYAYDIWGDTVNTAARMEQNSEPGKINISDTTYQLVKENFNCVHRGKLAAKNKGMIDMYFVERGQNELQNKN